MTLKELKAIIQKAETDGISEDAEVVFCKKEEFQLEEKYVQLAEWMRDNHVTREEFNLVKQNVVKNLLLYPVKSTDSSTKMQMAIFVFGMIAIELKFHQTAMSVSMVSRSQSKCRTKGNTRKSASKG